ncbi:MAG TPA: trypsin-like peptidase domain-containing protein, partial [Pyrinomonadaceae bacterium]
AQRANVQKARSKRDRLRREREASEDLLSKGSSTTKEQTLLSRRSAKDNALTTIKLSVIVLLSVYTFGIQAKGQQLREVFRNVQQAVVVVRTEQKGLAPFPLQGKTSLKGLGSGVLISNDGKVLTAAHLVDSADRTIIEFSGGELVPAHVVGCSISADVALLQLDGEPPNYIAAKLGNSDSAEVGDEIFVVGAPYGISRTLTAGHVSGRRILNSETDGTRTIEFLQTDAAINTGNSGSPIFNLNGEVVGIVSNIMSRSGGSEGLAFASTSNTARRVLLEHKSFWTGIDGVLIEGNLAKALNLTQPVGLLVQRVAEGSIAWRAGIRPGSLRANVEGEEIVLGGDIILRVNDIAIRSDASYDQIYERIGSNNSQQNLVITVIREGQTLKLAINNSSIASDK